MKVAKSIAFVSSSAIMNLSFISFIMVLHDNPTIFYFVIFHGNLLIC